MTKPPTNDDRVPNNVPWANDSLQSTRVGAIPSSDGDTRYAFLGPGVAPDELGRLGEYRVLKRLGAGGMGIVFLAEDPTLKRNVALKIVRPELTSEDDVRKRFLREARALAAVEHDNVVPVYHVGEYGGVPYLTMPLLKGESLADRLKCSGKLSPVEIVRIGREAAAGLAAVHSQGLVHRDLKPSNIWLEADSDRAKLLDFGLARQDDADSQLTHFGRILGTPAYMSPEQVRGATVDAKSDLFSLGCIMYEMATSRRPFQGENLLALARSIENNAPTPPCELDPQIPQPLSALILFLLAKEPHSRPESAAALVELLTGLNVEAIVAPNTFAPTTSKQSRPRRSFRGWHWAASAILALVSIMIWFNSQSNKTEENPSPSTESLKRLDPKLPLAGPEPGNVSGTWRGSQSGNIGPINLSGPLEFKLRQVVGTPLSGTVKLGKSSNPINRGWVFGTRVVISLKAGTFSWSWDGNVTGRTITGTFSVFNSADGASGSGTWRCVWE